MCNYIVCIVEKVSKGELARTIPVNLPTVKRKIKLRAHITAGDHLMFSSSGSSVGKESACSAGDPGSTPG